MSQDSRLFEPNVANALHSNRSWLNPVRGGDITARQAWAIHQALKPLMPMQLENDYKEVWFSVDRGEPDDWISFMDYKDEIWDEAAAPTVDDWKEEWLSWFPEKRYWHVLGCREDDGWLTIAIDNTVIVQVTPEEKDPYESEELIKTLYLLSIEAERTVEEIRQGHYGARIEKELPLERRYGLIKRSDLWKTADEWYRFGYTGIDDAEARFLADKLAAQPNKESIGRLETLSAGCYFDVLKEAYSFAGYQNTRDWFGGISADDGRAWYARFGDARDHSLLELASDSPDDFNAWYLKNKGCFDHNFEIFMGRGCSRVHLNPVLDDKGWYLAMWGSLTWHAADMARVWEFMNSAGMPTYIGDADRLAKSLLGQDIVLIMPTHFSTDYVRGDYFGHDIVTAIHL